MFDVSLLASLAASLLQGGPNIVEKLIARKIEHMGAKVLRDLITSQITPPGVDRIMHAFETGGISEVDRTRRQWLGAVTPKPLSGQTRFMSVLNRIINEKAKQADFQALMASRPTGRYVKWSRSRREWLDERWKHDWRTQPRDLLGRWIPGRLKHPYISRGARRIRSKRRRAARKAVRAIFKKGE